ncbi:CDC42 small effector protein 2-A [Varanus komodoensis]|nr:CDC42 small effector protein 2-A [Varanus komodoensis]
MNRMEVVRGCLYDPLERYDVLRLPPDSPHHESNNKGIPSTPSYSLSHNSVGGHDPAPGSSVTETDSLANSIAVNVGPKRRRRIDRSMIGEPTNFVHTAHVGSGDLFSGMNSCRPAELFRVVQGLVQPGPKKDPVPPSITRCDDFARHFKEKVAQIHHKLDSTSDSDSLGEVPMLPSAHTLLDEFQLLRPDDVDKVLGQVRTTTCLLDLCPSWLLSKAKHGIGSWIWEVIITSLKDGRVPAPLKEAVVRLVLKEASLDPEMAVHYRPVANILFFGKVLERVVAGQLQALLDETDYLDPFQSGFRPGLIQESLDETDYLDPFQSGFRPGYGTESALVTLYDDLCRERDRGSASLLVLLDLSAAFDTIDHGILLDRLRGLGVGGTACQWFRSCLDGRFQKVVLGDYGSAPWQLCHGVLQRSILFPLLFNIYMKPLGEVIRRCGLRNHQYADDTQLYLSFSTNPGDLDLVLNGVALPLKDRVLSLGVLLDPKLTLEAQVSAVVSSIQNQMQSKGGYGGGMSANVQMQLVDTKAG